MLVRIDNYGPDALLVRYATEANETAFVRGQALLRHLEAHPLPGLIEMTPGFTTLVLEFDQGGRPDPSLLAPVFDGVVRAAQSDPAAPRLIELPVVYDGPDLERVAEVADMPAAKVAELHSAAEYRVHVLGFSPGFPYLSGLDRRLHTPRLETPRPKVPAGSVAIGGEHAGVYPVSTAGGWNLIGRTNVPMLDPALAAVGSPEAFFLRVGDAVRFVPVERF